MREEKPELAEAAERGELPMLWWRGGVEQKLQANAPKEGTLFYLATWQGLRNQDLDIDLLCPPELTCSKTGQAVQYAPLK